MKAGSNDAGSATLWPEGARLLAQLSALSNPHRLRILAALHRGGRNYVSRLARELDIGRPLLHLHLQKLQESGLVRSRLELSSDGKALNFFEITDFDMRLNPQSIARAAAPTSIDRANEPQRGE